LDAYDFVIMQAPEIPDSAEQARLLASESHLAEARARQLTRPSLAPFATDALAGVAAGIATGAWCGPLGAVIGAFVGGVMGLGTGLALGVSDHTRDTHDAELDRAIGVGGGDMGAGEGAGLEYPPAILGLYSASSVASTFTGHEHAMSEGPMQEPD
jgi:hypothetical protein